MAHKTAKLVRELYDYYTVALDRLYEEEGQVTPSGIIKLEATWIDPEEATRFVYKKLNGLVVSAPMDFSEESVRGISPGLPEPRAFIHSDTIAHKYKMGDRLWSRKDYMCTTWNGYDTISLEDYCERVDIRPGDMLYFDESVSERENYLGKDAEGRLLFRCRADKIICVVRDGQIYMQGSWVLIEPVMETWEEITTPMGIIKKPKPEAKYLLATVMHIEANPDIQAGDRIFYLPDSNWGVTVEGKEYFGIREEEILAREKKSPDIRRASP